MIGNNPSMDGNKDRRIQAARDWLNRAENQFDSGQDVLAAATLMLAQAELKLMVEKVAGVSVSTLVEPRPRRFSLLPIGRTLIGAVALAACFLFGLYFGNAYNPTAPSVLPGDSVTHAVQIADAGEAVPLTEPVEVIPAIPTPTIEEPSEAVGPEEPSPVEGDHAAPAFEPAPSRPIYRPRPAYTPIPEPEPVVYEPVLPVAVNIVDETPGVTAGVDTVSSEGEISEAEVALATIRFLSERLLMEESE